MYRVRTILTESKWKKTCINHVIVTWVRLMISQKPTVMADIRKDQASFSHRVSPDEFAVSLHLSYIAFSGTSNPGIKGGVSTHEGSTDALPSIHKRARLVLPREAIRLLKGAKLFSSAERRSKVIRSLSSQQSEYNGE